MRGLDRDERRPRRRRDRPRRPEPRRRVRAFADADKTGAATHLELPLPRIAERGVIVVDDVLWSGAVIDDAVQDDDTVALRACNDLVAGRDDIHAVMLPIGDGVTLTRRREAVGGRAVDRRVTAGKMHVVPPVRRLAASVSLVLTVAACGGSDDAATIAATSAATAPATAPTSAPTSAPSEPTVAATTSPTTAAPPTTAPPTTAPPTTAPEPLPWSPVGPGPYDVGVASVVVDDPAGERPLTVDVWFPLDDGAGDLAPQQYTLLPGVAYESPAAFAATAEQIADDTFALVVYSHGSGGIRFVHSAYTEALAGHGHVVVAADHTGNTVFERLAGVGPSEQTAIDRPTDVSRLIDAFTDPANPVTGPYAEAIDADRIAVTGHSFGGFTSIAMVTGLDTSTGDVPPDERVDAIVPLAPAAGEALLGDERIASIDVPMMIVVGTDDATTPVDPNVTRLWELTSNSPAYRVELVAGEHQTFTDLCAYRDALSDVDGVPDVVVDVIADMSIDGCSPGDIDAVRAAEITITYVVEFLDEVFRDGPPIDPTVVAPPDDVIFAAR